MGSVAGTVPGGGNASGRRGAIRKRRLNPLRGKRAVVHATARFPATAYGFRRRVDGFLRKAPGARCVPLSNSFSTRGHWRQPHPEEGYSFYCSRITPRPNSNHSGETSKMVHTLMINAKSGILAPRSVPPKRGERRPQTCGKFALCHGAPYGLQPFLATISIGSVRSKARSPSAFLRQGAPSDRRFRIRPENSIFD